MSVSKKISLFTVLIAVIFVVCKVVNNNNENLTIESAKIEEGEVSGWKQDESKGYVQFVNATMFDLVNGGAKEYQDRGVVEGFQQRMIKENTDRTYQGWICDFGTSEKAKEMYTFKETAASTKESVPDFPDTVAFFTTLDFGYEAYVRYNSYLIWVWFDDFGSQKSDAKNTAINFIKMTIEKIKKLK